MATAEGQHRLIATILFGIAFFVCGFLTYYFYDQVAPAEQRANDAIGKERKALADLGQARKNYLELRRRVLGEENTEDHASATKLIDDQRQFPGLADARMRGEAPWPGEQAYTAKGTYAHYQDALNYLHTSLTQNDQRIAELEKQKRDLEAKVNAIEDEYNAKYKQARDQQVSTNTQLSQDTASLLAELKTKEKNLDTYIERYNQKVQELNELLARRAEQEARLKGIKAGLDEILAEKEFMAELRERLRFDGVDGTVVRVQDNGLTAEIDVGQADGLRTGTAFGVFGRDSGGNPHELPKAFMEVTEVIGPHRARVRVTNEQLSSPVLPGDFLSSPLWKPGDKEGIAFVGYIHIDKDGKPDNTAFRNLVLKAGGKIDAEFDLKTLKTRGKIDVRTGWLVVGEVPDPSTAKSPEEKELLEAMKAAEKKFRDQAGDHGVSVTSVRNYLNYLSHNVPDSISIPNVTTSRRASNGAAVTARFTSQTYPDR